MIDNQRRQERRRHLLRATDPETHTLKRTEFMQRPPRPIVLRGWTNFMTSAEILRAHALESRAANFCALYAAPE